MSAQWSLHRLPASDVGPAPRNITAHTANERVTPLITLTTIIVCSLHADCLNSPSPCGRLHRLSLNREEFRWGYLRILPHRVVKKAQSAFSFWAERYVGVSCSRDGHPQH